MLLSKRWFKLASFSFAANKSKLSKSTSKVSSKLSKPEVPEATPEAPVNYVSTPEWKAYEEKVKSVRRQYLTETIKIPTKAQTQEHKRDLNKTNRDATWDKYLEEMRPKLAAMPHGTQSIRASLRDLLRKRPPVIKSETFRAKALQNFIKARSQMVLEKRRKVVSWVDSLKVIEEKDWERAIEAAWKRPCERNQPIEALIKQQLEKRERIQKIVPHQDALEESILLVKK